MKIAISIKDEIFREIEAYAKERHCSRSEVLSMAVSEFLEKEKSQKLLEAINEAYSGAEPEEEARLREAGKRRYGARVLKERY
ncbi:MAG TPA: hypothetical protein VJM57_01820 [Thermodesulfobacteriota bacterium]|nr:hypothetical protein [Thermodesulfobacteriota bacterium]